MLDRGSTGIVNGKTIVDPYGPEELPLIARLPAAPDRIVKQEDASDGLKQMAIEKEIDGQIVVVEDLRTGRK